MIILRGKVRKVTAVKLTVYKDNEPTDAKRDAVKIAVEHEIEGDLRLESFVVDPTLDAVAELAENKTFDFEVRPYPSGKLVKYAVTDILGSVAA